MTLRHKQQGFAMLAGLLIVIGTLAIGGIYYSQYLTKQRIVRNSESFYNRVLYLKTQIHAYASDHYQDGWPINGSGIFPTELSDLEGDYVPECSAADNAQGFCMAVNQTPWGEIADEDYRVIGVPDDYAPEYFRAEIDLHLPDKDDAALKFEREATLSLFAQLPNIVYDDDENLLTVRIDRPDKAFAYDGLVKRSGDDSELLGDWDVGGDYSVTNAKDYTIRNSDGSQKIVSRGLTDIYTLEHEDRLEKPACPTGTEPRIALALGKIKVPKEYELFGSQKPYLIETTDTDWQVGLEIRVKELSSGEYTSVNQGEILAITQCK